MGKCEEKCGGGGEHGERRAHRSGDWDWEVSGDRGARFLRGKDEEGKTVSARDSPLSSPLPLSYLLCARVSHGAQCVCCGKSLGGGREGRGCVLCGMLEEKWESTELRANSHFLSFPPNLKKTRALSD